MQRTSEPPHRAQQWRSILIRDERRQFLQRKPGFSLLAQSHQEQDELQMHLFSGALRTTVPVHVSQGVILLTVTCSQELTS